MTSIFILSTKRTAYSHAVFEYYATRPLAGQQADKKYTDHRGMQEISEVELDTNRLIKVEFRRWNSDSECWNEWEIDRTLTPDAT